jgi:hypothetical protein
LDMSRSRGAGSYSLSRVPGQALVRGGPNYVDRIWNSLVSLRNYNGIDFRLIFEYVPSEAEVSSVDLHTGVLPIVSLKLFADHSEFSTTCDQGPR